MLPYHGRISAPEHIKSTHIITTQDNWISWDRYTHEGIIWGITIYQINLSKRWISCLISARAQNELSHHAAPQAGATPCPCITIHTSHILQLINPVTH